MMNIVVRRSDKLGSSRKQHGLLSRLKTLGSGMVAMVTMAMVTIVMLVMASIGETHSGHRLGTVESGMVAMMTMTMATMAMRVTIASPTS